jgi:hypothetical protein
MFALESAHAGRDACAPSNKAALTVRIVILLPKRAVTPRIFSANLSGVVAEIKSLTEDATKIERGGQWVRSTASENRRPLNLKNY